jgi:hypothetical protein
VVGERVTAAIFLHTRIPSQQSRVTIKTEEMRRMLDVKGHCHQVFTDYSHTHLASTPHDRANRTHANHKMTVVQIADKAGLQALFAKGGKAVVYLSATW